MGIRSVVGTLIGDRRKAKIKTIQAAVSFVRSGGTVTDRVCNICGYEGPFYPFGLHLRRDAGCPHCGSFERHRLFTLWIESNIAEIRGKSVLHFAPEKSIGVLIAREAGSYLTADLLQHDVDRRINIEETDGAGRFDIVIASHVLEHVDDRKALGSIYKSLNPGGLFLTMVPVIYNVETHEDPAITDPKMRQLYFGQCDHLRAYGRDFDDRVRSAGFELALFTASEPLVVRHGLIRGDTLYVCRKGRQTNQANRANHAG